MKIRYRRAMLLLLLVCFTTGTVFARKFASVQVNNQIETGDIRISLKEFSRQDNLLIPYEDGKLVLPSEQISKIPVVTNEEAAAYVRFRTVYRTDTESQPVSGPEAEADSCREASLRLEGIPAGWIQAGSWYYRIAPLAGGESCELFQAVVLPETWTEGKNDESFAVDVIAEAIQAANFKPDYSSASPWGEHEIQTCIHESGNHPIQSMQTYSGLRIELEGDTEQLVHIPENFFSNLAVLMPGDAESDQIQLKNNTNWPAELFFSTDLPDSCTDSEQLLLEACQLRLRLGNTVLYDGPLHAETLQKEISLGIYEAGQSGTLTLELELPKECDNEFAKLAAHTIWKFRAGWEETASDHFGSVPVSPWKDSWSSSLGSLAIKTGLSENRIRILLVLFLMTAAGYLFLSYRKERNQS